jgi:phosphonate transport system permease protein
MSERKWLLSAFLPGAGQFLGGRRYRGGAILLLWLILVVIVAAYGQPIWWISPILIWLWNIWDAFHLQRLGREASLFLPLLAGLSVLYGIGWQITQIDLRSADMRRALQIVRPMLRPDFVQPRRELNQMWVEILVPCKENPPRAFNKLDGKTAMATPDCARVGEVVIVSVQGLWPNTDTQIWWQTPIGDPKMLGPNESQMLILPTDENGALSATIRVPTTALVAAPDPSLALPHRVYFDQYRNVGGWELSFNGREVLKGAGVTIAMALMATVLASLFAIPISFLAARNLMGGHPVTLAIYFAVRTFLNVLRSIESLILALIFVVIVGLGPFAGVLALALHSIAALGKLYADVLESIDPGPIEAIRATGANWAQVVRYAVIPQIISPFVAFTIYRWDINVRSATIIGLVGGGGIGYLLVELIRINDMRGVSAVFITIAVIVIALDVLSARIRERLV